MMKRALSIFLTGVFLLGLLPTSVLAAEANTGGLCPHHQEHSFEDCGFIEAVEGQLCGFVCRICPVQALIDALPAPEDITANNRAEAEAQLAAIDTARIELTGEEMEQLNTSRYQAVVSALAALDGQAGNDLPMPLTGETTTVNYQKPTFSGDKLTGFETASQAATVVTVADATNGWGGSEADKEYWYVVNSDVEFAQRVTVTGDVHLILTDGCYLDASNGGINVGENQSLTIYAQSTGSSMGVLTAMATSTVDGAGIGGGFNKHGGTITINGGNVTATGNRYSAGIGGGGNSSRGGTITINGGNVTATGNDRGAGIGGSLYGEGGIIKITGGTVIATGNGGGAGIGGGGSSSPDRGHGGDITISGGTVTATSNGGGAGIGDGNSGNKGTFKAIPQKREAGQRYGKMRT